MLTNQLQRKLILFLFCLFIAKLNYAQKSPSSEEAFEQYQSITRIMEQSFSENEFKTYRRESFSEQELQSYLTKHFQRLDLLPYIKGRHAFKLNSYLHSGNWFKEIGFPKSSIKWYNTFFDYYNEKIDSLSVAEKEGLVKMIAYSYSVQANNYAEIGELTNAALTHKKNIKFVKGLNTISNPSAINNYGLFFYWTKKDLDSALIYFNKAYAITKESFPKHTLLGSIRDNIADIYIEKNQPEKALVLYKENFKLYKHTKNEKSNQFDLQRLISAGSQLVETEIKLNLLDQANQSFIKLQEKLDNPKIKNEIRNDSKLELFKAQEALLVSQNKFKAAYDIAKKRSNFTDSLSAISKIADSNWQDELNTISLDRVALNFEIDRIQKENKISSQRSKLWIISITSLSLVGFLTALFMRRQGHIIIAKSEKLFAEQNLKLTDLENKQLQSEIESKKRDLSDFAINLSQNQEWAKSLADKLKKIKSTNGKELKVLLDVLEQDINGKIKFDHDTEDFYERLDKLSDSFYCALHTNYPNLTKTEIRLCSLIRLKINSHAISSLQNITVSSLNTSRYRLRKKLNLSENDNLDEFIQFL